MLLGRWPDLAAACLGWVAGRGTEECSLAALTCAARAWTCTAGAFRGPAAVLQCVNTHAYPGTGRLAGRQALALDNRGLATPRATTCSLGFAMSSGR